MKCPRDNSLLTIQSKKDIVGYCCRQCSGIFLNGYGRTTFKVNYGSTELEYTFDEPSCISSQLICPKCERQMQTTCIGDTEVDFCYYCKGIWHDENEMETIVKDFGNKLPSNYGGFGFFTGYVIIEILFWILVIAIGSGSISGGCSV